MSVYIWKGVVRFRTTVTLTRTNGPYSEPNPNPNPTLALTLNPTHPTDPNPNAILWAPKSLYDSFRVIVGTAVLNECPNLNSNLP